ncbi:Uncharacterised protein [Acinetobacter baumannii]|nr:Uncharacterised protein [Acinetobacter baumannii]
MRATDESSTTSTRLVTARLWVSASTTPWDTSSDVGATSASTFSTSMISTNCLSTRVTAVR